MHNPLDAYIVRIDALPALAWDMFHLMQDFGQIAGISYTELPNGDFRYRYQAFPDTPGTFISTEQAYHKLIDAKTFLSTSSGFSSHGLDTRHLDLPN